VGEGLVIPLSESRDAGDPHVRFDERDLETELLSYRARSRLYRSAGRMPFMSDSTLNRCSAALYGAELTQLSYPQRMAKSPFFLRVLLP
jgi:hypothetical protein